jgi:hypothetical protein
VGEDSRVGLAVSYFATALGFFTLGFYVHWTMHDWFQRRRDSERQR